MSLHRSRPRCSRLRCSGSGGRLRHRRDLVRAWLMWSFRPDRTQPTEMQIPEVQIPKQPALRRPPIGLCRERMAIHPRRSAGRRMRLGLAHPCHCSRRAPLRLKRRPASSRQIHGSAKQRRFRCPPAFLRVGLRLFVDPQHCRRWRYLRLPEHQRRLVAAAPDLHLPAFRSAVRLRRHRRRHRVRFRSRRRLHSPDCRRVRQRHHFCRRRRRSRPSRRMRPCDRRHVAAALPRRCDCLLPACCCPRQPPVSAPVDWTLDTPCWNSRGHCLGRRRSPVSGCANRGVRRRAQWDWG